jgi:hypothetical protein
VAAVSPHVISVVNHRRYLKTGKSKNIFLSSRDRSRARQEEAFVIIWMRGRALDTPMTVGATHSGDG